MRGQTYINALCHVKSQLSETALLPQLTPTIVGLGWFHVVYYSDQIMPWIQWNIYKGKTCFQFPCPVYSSSSHQILTTARTGPIWLKLPLSPAEDTEWKSRLLPLLHLDQISSPEKSHSESSALSRGSYVELPIACSRSMRPLPHILFKGIRRNSELYHSLSQEYRKRLSTVRLVLVHP